ncbi:LuxR family transcriptional regulator, partial [Streptomyces sp. Tu 6176]|uniref:response regulator n=2 Tax=Streptomyces TaxID=1883 RepID=UPI000447DA8B
MTIRILLADDQQMIRSAYGMILGSQPDMEIVASVADGATAVQEARRLRPDVCLLDIRMPGLDGLEATRLLAGPDAAEPLNVLIATTFDVDEYVYRALRNGACGFLLKDGSPALLVEAVRAVAADNALISPSITVRLLKHM